MKVNYSIICLLESIYNAIIGSTQTCMQYDKYPKGQNLMYKASQET